MKISLKTISPIYQNKHNFVKENIKKISKNNKVLDVGCGYGEYLNLYEERGAVVAGMDVDKEAIKGIKNARYASITSIPFEDNSFDTLNCIDVLEHVDDEDKAFSELSRVLKKDGTLIMTVPNRYYPISYDPINRLLMVFGKHLKIGMWHWGHKRLYSKKHLLSMLNKNGFQIIRYQQRSHFLIALFVNYIPYLMDRFVIKSDYKKKKKSSIFLFLINMMYSTLNSIDKILFSKLNGISHCVVAVKN